MNKISNWKAGLKGWLEGFAETRYARLVVFLHSLVDSSIFPLTVDISLLAVSVARPKRSFQFAIWASLGSIIGGILAFYIGKEFMLTFGADLVEFLGYQDEWLKATESFQGKFAAYSVALAALTPVSFTLACLAAGAMDMNFVNFVLVIVIFRTVRFLIVAVLTYYLGEKVKIFFDNYYQMISIIFFILLAAIILLLILI